MEDKRCSAVCITHGEQSFDKIGSRPAWLRRSAALMVYLVVFWSFLCWGVIKGQSFGVTDDASTEDAESARASAPLSGFGAKWFARGLSVDGGSSNDSNATADSTEGDDRFAQYDVCDLSEPHLVLGLPDPASDQPPSIQGVWVAYYSRVTVAEHQPRQFSLYKLYCSAMAAKKLLHRIAPKIYPGFAPENPDKYFGAAGDPQGTAAESIEDRLTASVEAGHEVEAMLLHPDIFDPHVVKALLALGWQEMKFYEVGHPVWMEWLQDEYEERQSWIYHMDEEIAQLGKKQQVAAEDSIRAQLKDRFPELHGISVGAAAEESQGEAKGPKGVETSLFRRLDALLGYESVFENSQVRKDLEAARAEMIRVNTSWDARRSLVTKKWVTFVEGAQERIQREQSAAEGESWEEAMEWMGQKLAADPEGSRDYCEGYLLETVLQLNKVKRISGKAWTIQKQRNNSFKQLLTSYNDNGPSASKDQLNDEDEDVVLLRSYTRDPEPILQQRPTVSNTFPNGLDAEVDALVEQLVEESEAFDIDMDQLIAELEHMNVQDIYEHAMKATGSPDEAAAASTAMFTEIENVLEDMVMLEERARGTELHNIDDLVGSLMSDYEVVVDPAEQQRLVDELTEELARATSAGESHPSVSEEAGGAEGDGVATLM